LVFREKRVGYRIPGHQADGSEPTNAPYIMKDKSQLDLEALSTLSGRTNAQRRK